MRILFLLRKEFLQLMRDKILMIVLFYAFTVMIYTAGKGVVLQVQKFPTIIKDESKSPKSRELISRFRKPYFKILGFVESDKEILEKLDKGEASMAIIIPSDFKRKLDKGKAKIQVIIDGTISMTATMAIFYVTEITRNYSLESFDISTLPGVKEKTRIKFNPNNLSSWFMSLLELFNMITMISLLITSAALIREKEHGTIEQLLITPVKSWEVFFAKIIPTVFVIGSLSLISLFLMIKGVFRVPVKGSIILFSIGNLLYIFTMASIGIAIATVVKNLSQAMMVIIAILVPILMISGAWSPPEAMHPVARYISLLSPMRYFLDFGYGVLLKGNSLKYVWKDILGIFSIGTIVLVFSALRFRKSFAK
ncbi:MAG: ABC transporter permease [Thermodesulfobacterium geofontis]|uniref:ABC transporter permease n=1 Tax=Thermodesulfobacterium geofontis TaxID=1295609 RepID=A0A2N7PQ77_9BACT|nr:MAG: ABC transporter permease [Thermodesulfobacterium geofontis]